MNETINKIMAIDKKASDFQASLANKKARLRDLNSKELTFYDQDLKEDYTNYKIRLQKETDEKIEVYRQGAEDKLSVRLKAMDSYYEANKDIVVENIFQKMIAIESSE